MTHGNRTNQGAVHNNAARPVHMTVLVCVGGHLWRAYRAWQERDQIQPPTPKTPAEICRRRSDRWRP